MNIKKNMNFSQLVTFDDKMIRTDYSALRSKVQWLITPIVCTECVIWKKLRLFHIMKKEKSIGAKKTDEVAIMVESYHRYGVVQAPFPSLHNKPFTPPCLQDYRAV